MAEKDREEAAACCCCIEMLMTYVPGADARGRRTGRRRVWLPAGRGQGTKAHRDTPVVVVEEEEEEEEPLCCTVIQTAAARGCARKIVTSAWSSRAAAMWDCTGWKASSDG